MKSIDKFPLKRFKISCNLIVTLCRPNNIDKWVDPSKSEDVKANIYKGAFIECIEYLYGFLPEVFREYCSANSLPVKFIGKGAKTLDFVEAVYVNGAITKDQRTFITTLVKVRGKLIHDTLINQEVYYDYLNEIIKRLNKFDLENLVKTCMSLISNVNRTSLEWDAERKDLIAVRRDNSPNKHVKRKKKTFQSKTDRMFSCLDSSSKIAESKRFKIY